jgi:hypothetical protein
MLIPLPVPVVVAPRMRPAPHHRPRLGPSQKLVKRICLRFHMERSS